MKKFFAIVALTLGISGVFAAGAATPASAANEECELVSVWLTVRDLIPTTHLVCL
jgi:hypothetical protein